MINKMMYIMVVERNTVIYSGTKTKLTQLRLSI